MAVQGFDDDFNDIDLSALSEPQRLRIMALEIAVDHLSMTSPRWTVEQAREEIFALAEHVLDDLYGEREKRLVAMPFREYLATPEWDERRRAAYRKADYRCQLCNAQHVQLEAHHRSYHLRGRPEEQADLTVLCARCHKAAHDFIWQVDEP